MTDPEVISVATDSTTRRSEVGAALAELARAGQVSFYFDLWNADDPKRIDEDRAEVLLRDCCWFDPRTEKNGHRLSYVNVENAPEA